MKKTKKIQKKGLLIWPLILVIGILLFVIITVNQHQNNQPTKIHAQDYTPEELHTFWNKNFQTPINDLTSGKCLPELNQRYLTLSNTIVSLYGRKLKYQCVMSHSEVGKESLAMSCVESNTPIIIFFVTEMHNFYDRKSVEGIEPMGQLMYSCAQITILHEMEHLAQGEKGFARLGSATEQVDVEKRTWALSCEYALDPMSQHSFYIPNFCKYYYSEWLNAGRNVNNPAWAKAINQAYRQTRVKGTWQ